MCKLDSRLLIWSVKGRMLSCEQRPRHVCDSNNSNSNIIMFARCNSPSSPKRSSPQSSLSASLPRPVREKISIYRSGFFLILSSSQRCCLALARACVDCCTRARAASEKLLPRCVRAASIEIAASGIAGNGLYGGTIFPRTN